MPIVGKSSTVIPTAIYAKMVGHLEEAGERLRALAYAKDAHADYVQAMATHDSIVGLLALLPSVPVEDQGDGPKAA